MEDQNRNWLWIAGGCAGLGCLATGLAVFFFLVGLGSLARDTPPATPESIPDVRALDDDALVVLDDGQLLSVEEVAGGERVQHRLGDGGVLPAEDEFARVEEAGFGFQPGEASQYGLFWQFTVTVRRDDLAEVLVEDVTVASGVDAATVAPTTLVHDQAPVVEASQWRGTTPAYILERDNLPWFFSDEKSGFVFRLTLRFADGATSRLHQRAEFTDEVKAGAREQLRQAGWIER